MQNDSNPDRQRGQAPRVSTGERSERGRTGRPEHGRRPRAGQAEAEPPLVHRDLRNPPSEDEAGSPLPPALTATVRRRRQRFSRRQTSGSWLIGHARLDAGLEPDAEGVTAADADWVRPPRPARCSWTTGAGVGVHHDGGETSAHFSGLERCGSIWACPVCAGVIRAQRSEEIEAAATAHVEAGGGLVFVTLTMSHGVADPLETTLDAALEGWRRLVRGKAWTTFKANWGVVGYVRAVEVTVGDEHGWHPHIHALLFTEEPLNDGNAAAMKYQLTPRWQRYVTERGGGLPSDSRGVDVRTATGAASELAGYLSKIQDEGHEHSRKAANELARGDMKTGHATRDEKRHRVPFELLDGPWPDEVEQAWDAALWWEYVTTTKGRRAITWSKGLKARYEIEDKTDDEVMDDVEGQEVLITVEALNWRRSVRNRPLRAARVLELVEVGQLSEAAALAGGLVMRAGPPPPS